MEILLPHCNNYHIQPSTLTTNHLCPVTGISKRVIGTMHRASAAAAKDDGSQRKNNFLPESDNDDDIASTAQEEQETRVFVQEPLPFDVLCGHDRNYNKHPGNQVYRQVIEGHVSVYKSDIPKQEKMNITRSILSIMEHQYGSRFIRRCCDNANDPESDVSATKKKRGNNSNDRNSGYNTVATWQVLTHMEARDKISHALRSHKQKQQSSDGNSATFSDRNDDIILAGIHNASTNNVVTADTSSDMNVGLPSPIGMRHEKILLEDAIGHYGVDSFDDDNSISFDDSKTLIDLFSEDAGKSTPSASSAMLNLDNDIPFMDDPWCGVSETSTGTIGNYKRKRKGS